MNLSWLGKTAGILAEFYTLNPVPYLVLGVWLGFSCWYVRRAFRDYAGINRYLLQMIPFVFTILGLLGAVSGSLGFIWSFSPTDLLGGSSTLFKGVLGSCVTAIVGIVLSLIFSKLISMTHYKVELQKALENNELFVLKRMFKLQIKAHAAERKNVALTLEAIKGVRRDVQNLAPGLEKSGRSMAETLQQALGGKGSRPLSQSLDGLQAELERSVAAQARQAERQAKLLEQLGATLAGPSPQSLGKRLEALQREQQQRGKALEAALAAVGAQLERNDTQALGRLLQQSLSEQTERLGAALQAQGEAADLSRKDASLVQSSALQAMHDALYQALTEARQQEREIFARDQAETRNELAALARQQQEQHRELLDSHAEQEARIRELLDEGRRQTRELAALATVLAPLSQTPLPAALQALQERVRELAEELGQRQGTLEQGLAAQRTLLEQTRDVLTGELLRQQSRVVAEAVQEAREQFTRELGPGLRHWLQQLERRLDEHRARQEQEAASNSQGLAGLAASHQEQEQRLTTLTAQLRELGREAASGFAQLAQLAARSEELTKDSRLLREFLLRAEKTLRSGSALQQALGKLASKAGAPVEGEGALSSGLGESMQQLVARLREIDAIKRRDGKFWRKVESQMNDGIPIIMGGNKLHLSDDLNGSFQDRLQRSFSNLDRILQTIVAGYQGQSRDSSLQ